MLSPSSLPLPPEGDVDLVGSHLDNVYGVNAIGMQSFLREKGVSFS